ncbi:hypothetical protein [Sphingopyxis terrae]|uniref:hypothetical protein n=1 Tax=Sphingopyxis terrae TaxID=33052 RepID=UPI002A15E7DE|nr:hypothetical protein [Sphingopyxis terrae]MDX8357870.1 hypothetical protein [Sphingopyxis terrae]
MNYSDSLVADRYKYVLSQKQALNDKTFKIASFYQAFTIVIAAAQFEIVRSFHKEEIDAAFSVASSWGLLIVLALVSVISLAMTIGGILAWRSYSREEYEILSKSPSDKVKVPMIVRAFSWYETYIIIAIILAVAGHIVALPCIILPALR